MFLVDGCYSRVITGPNNNNHYSHAGHQHLQDHHPSAQVVVLQVLPRYFVKLISTVDTGVYFDSGTSRSAGPTSSCPYGSASAV